MARAVQQAQERPRGRSRLSLASSAPRPNPRTAAPCWRACAGRSRAPTGATRSTIPLEYRDLVPELPKRLALATPERPLVLFLDALDQLSGSDNARSLIWLPPELPPHVRLVVSTLPGECLVALQSGSRLLHAASARTERARRSAPAPGLAGRGTPVPDGRAAGRHNGQVRARRSAPAPGRAGRGGPDADGRAAGRHNDQVRARRRAAALSQAGLRGSPALARLRRAAGTLRPGAGRKRGHPGGHPRPVLAAGAGEQSRRGAGSARAGLPGGRQERPERG